MALTYKFYTHFYHSKFNVLHRIALLKDWSLSTLLGGYIVGAMHRQATLKDIDRYQKTWATGRAAFPHFDAAEEAATIKVFQHFITTHANCHHRECIPGHLTGSALVTTPQFDQVLLTLHGKLNKWLQLGGHADGDPDLSQVAAREVGEESGLSVYHFLKYERLFGESGALPPLPFDLDYHDIPARKNEAAHIHYDVRYLIVADAKAPLGITEESKDLRWLPLAEARKLTHERSMHRQFDKLIWLKQQMS